LKTIPHPPIYQGRGNNQTFGPDKQTSVGVSGENVTILSERKTRDVLGSLMFLYHTEIQQQKHIIIVIII